MIRALRQVEEWPTRAAVGVLRDGRVVGTVGPLHELFAWASLTKPVVALAVLVATEEGTLELERVRPLLAHIAPEGRRIYSNEGFLRLAEELEQAAGLPWAEYVAEAVLVPLGMAHTRFEGDAAAGLHGPLVDLLALTREWAVPTLIDASTHQAAVSVQQPGLPGVLPGYREFADNAWGLGVEIRTEKHPHWTGATNSPATFGHFGQSGSFFWVDPAAGVACAGLADTPFGPWAARAWPRLADDVLAEVA